MTDKKKDKPLHKEVASTKEQPVLRRGPGSQKLGGGINISSETETEDEPNINIKIGG